MNNALTDVILKRPETRDGSFVSLRMKTSVNEQRKEAVSLNEDRVEARHCRR